MFAKIILATLGPSYVTDGYIVCWLNCTLGYLCPMLKAITTYLHKITFGNRVAQPHDQFPNPFKKYITYYFCYLI